MVPAAEIDALYESTLKPRLQALEGLRLELRTHIIKAGLLVGIPALVLWANDIVALAMPDGFGWLPMALGFLGVLAGVTIAGMKYLLPGIAAHTNYRVRFKHEVAAEVFTIVCPSAQYSPLEGISEAIFDEPGLFNPRGGFTSDDRVRGVIGTTPFEAADASRSYSTGGKNSTRVVVFRGLFFHLDFNKRLSGRTYVDPKSAGGASAGDRSNLTEVALENAAFAEQFRVYTTDEVEARYILTPAMMERILAVAAMSGKRVHLAFANNRAYLGVHYGRALFEPAIKDSTSVAAIHEMAAHFALAEGIVEELDLNTRIWTKGVDASLLHAPEEAPKDELIELARGGTLTAEKIWEAALAAQHTDAGDEAADADVVPPSDSAIQIERGAGTAAVHYGLGLSWVMTVLFWVASVAFAIASARLLADAIPVPQLAALAARLPEIPYATPLAASLPIAFFGASMMIGPFLFLMWTMRVRRVEIAADAVRIWRGLRPIPRTYARPPYGKVVLQNNAVFVGRTEGFSLVNASASPILDPGEARWVAAEMRRAMRETAPAPPR